MDRRSLFKLLMGLPFVPAILRVPESTASAWDSNVYKAERYYSEVVGGHNDWDCDTGDDDPVQVVEITDHHALVGQHGWRLTADLAFAVEAGRVVDEDGWPYKSDTVFSIQQEGRATRWFMDGEMVRMVILPEWMMAGFAGWNDEGDPIYERD